MNLKREQYRIEIRRQSTQALFREQRQKMLKASTYYAQYQTGAHVVTQSNAQNTPAQHYAPATHAPGTEYSISPQHELLMQKMAQNQAISDEDISTVLRQLVSYNLQRDMANVETCFRIVTQYLACSGDALAYRLNLVYTLNIVQQLQDVLNAHPRQMDDQFLYTITELIANLSCGDDKLVRNLFEIDALLESLFEFINLDKPHIVENVLYAFSNMLGGKQKFLQQLKNMMLRGGLIQHLKTIATDMIFKPGFEQHDLYVHLLETYVWLLSNVFRECPPPAVHAVNLIPIIVEIFDRTLLQKSIFLNVMWTINYFFQFYDTIAPELIMAIGDKRWEILVKIGLNDAEEEEQLLFVRMVSNALAGNNLAAKQLIEINIIETFVYLMESPKNHLRKEVAWGFSNLAACDLEQVNKLLENKVFMAKFKQKVHEEVPEVKREYIVTLANFLYQADAEVYSTIKSEGLLHILVENLSSRDNRLVAALLDACHALFDKFSSVFTADGRNVMQGELDQYGFTTKLEELIDHRSDEVRKVAEEIVTSYYSYGYE